MDRLGRCVSPLVSWNPTPEGKWKCGQPSLRSSFTRAFTWMAAWPARAAQPTRNSAGSASKHSTIPTHRTTRTFLRPSFDPLRHSVPIPSTSFQPSEAERCCSFRNGSAGVRNRGNSHQGALRSPMTTALAMLNSQQLVHLSFVDFVIVVFYFVLVLAIGFYLKEQANTGEDFFLAGREMTAWVAGLSFLSANLGALELMGWAGAAYQYGILAAHWYWIGAIPAMLFLALVMMPFYYISRTHSVPGYLKLRFGESSRALSAISFAFMTVLMSGVNMFAMAKVMQIVLGWDINFSIWVSSITVAVYVTLGGLRSAIFNEVLQFFLIWAGALLIPILGLYEAGGWGNLKILIAQRASEQYVHLWSTLGHFNTNPMGIHWTGIVFGLGAVISMGYWTTDFLVVQRILSAKDIRSAEMAPIIGAGFKMMVPFIVILPGLLGLGLLPEKLVPESAAAVNGGHSFNDVLPLMMARYCGPGLLGLG